MIKIFFSALTVFLSALNLEAGEFSKIDQEIRETIVETFGQNRRGQPTGQIDFQHDIWNLTILPNLSEDCLIEVSAFFNKPSPSGKIPSTAWICIHRDPDGSYAGEVTGHKESV